MLKVTKVNNNINLVQLFVIFIYSFIKSFTTMEGVIATIMMFAGNFAPKNWAFCQGQILSIAQNTALFSLLGTTYGGNGTTTFALPDLRGRVPVGTGQGPGLSNYALGQMSGAESVTMSVNQMPAHQHGVTPPAKNGGGDDTNPGGTKFMATASTDLYANASNVTMGAYSTGVAGGNQPLPIVQPYLGMNYVICLYGVYPSRN
jgi:microcystin-dependent protein